MYTLLQLFFTLLLYTELFLCYCMSMNGLLGSLFLKHFVYFLPEDCKPVIIMFFNITRLSCINMSIVRNAIIYFFSCIECQVGQLILIFMWVLLLHSYFVVVLYVHCKYIIKYCLDVRIIKFLNLINIFSWEAGIICFGYLQPMPYCYLISFKIYLINI